MRVKEGSCRDRGGGRQGGRERAGVGRVPPAAKETTIATQVWGRA